MNKKFLSAILFGALVASTGSFVSCADNDDKIDQLQDQNSELKAQLAQLKSELQAELKNAASASQVAAIEAKLSAIEGVTSDNIAATVAALKGNFDTQEARVIALETQIKALEGLKDVDASELIAVLNKAKENGTADMSGLSAMVDALDADVNTLVSALRSLVFQPEFYVDGIEAAEYTYLRYVELPSDGDIYTEVEGWSQEHSKDWKDDAEFGTTETKMYEKRNKKFKIIPNEKFPWGYAHTGDLTYNIYPHKWNQSSLNTKKVSYTYTDGVNDKGTKTNVLNHIDHVCTPQCAVDGCLLDDKEIGIFYAPAANVKVVGDKIMNTVTFAKNPSNARIDDAARKFLVQNICAMTRGAVSEEVMVIESIDETTKPGYAIVTYYVPTAQLSNLITAKHDESLSVLNQKDNTTIFRLQSGAYDAAKVESDWAALYETEIQPVAIALNAKGVSDNWYAPNDCDEDKVKLPNELHKNPYEVVYDATRTTSLGYNDTKGINIAEHIALHFVKRDNKGVKHGKNNQPEVQHQHVVYSLKEAAEKFGFEYEFKLVPYNIDDNKTNNSSYAHLVDGTAEGVNYKDAVIIANTVDEKRAAVDADPFAYIPKVLEDGSYEQGPSSVDKEPLVQVLVKKGGQVILDGYLSFIITRTTTNIMSDVFDLGSKDKSCATLLYAQTWNQVSEILYENTANNKLGMSKLEFEEVYELAKYDDKFVIDGDGVKHPVAKQFKVGIDGETITTTEIEWKNTYTEVYQEFDPNGITNTVLALQLDKFDQQYIYEHKEKDCKKFDASVKEHEDVIYVKYVRRGSGNHATTPGIVVPLKLALNDASEIVGTYGSKDVNYWYDATGAIDITPDDAVRMNVNYAKDNGDTYKQTEIPFLDEDKLGFVRDLDNNWDGNKLTFKNAKNEVLYTHLTDGPMAVYYFHPMTNNVVILDQNDNTTEYELHVDNDFVICNKWEMGDDPLFATGNHNKDQKIVVANMTVEEFAAFERDHMVNAKEGIYKNTKLYGRIKTAKNDQPWIWIAQLDPVTGNVQYFWDTKETLKGEDALYKNTMSKKIINAVSHAVKENVEGAKEKDKVFVGVYATDCEGTSIYPVGPNVFPNYFLRPLDILPGEGKKVLDAKNNADYITVFDLFNFQDWRDIKFINGTDYSNIWLLAYYNVNWMKVDVDAATTNLNNNDLDKKPLKEVNAYVKLSYVEHNKVTPMEDAVYGKNVKTINMKPYNKASMGVPSTYDHLVEHFGYIKYENNGNNVSDFDVKIPVTFGYDWGILKTTITVHVDGTIANNGGK